MKIARMSLILDTVLSSSRSQRDFEIFLHLPQYKLSSPIYLSFGASQEAVIKYVY